MIPSSFARLLLKQWLKHGLEKKRGGWRVAQALVRSQDAAPVVIDSLAPVYVDLRGFDLLETSLFLAAPGEPEFEREDRAIFRKLVREGDVVFDIGANIGYHLALFSSLVGASGRVYGFEPQPALLPNLRRTVQGMPNATLFECALSDNEGEVTLHVPEHGYHMLAAIGDPGVASKEMQCLTARLDGFWAAGKLAAPDFIKIDVEGAETLVFRGSEQLLNRSDAPIVFFEQWQEAAERTRHGGTEAADILLSFSRAGFALFACAGSELRPLVLNDVKKGNLLAVPESRRQRLPTRL
jgi:FkbM family methyltransferase